MTSWNIVGGARDSISVGDVTVTPILDVVIPFNYAALRYPEDWNVNLETDLVVPDVMVHSFLIEAEGRFALVDTGCGVDGTPAGGTLVQKLEQRGIVASDISAVLLTHLHSDHAAGLVTADGEKAFPKATLVVHEKELAFWNSPPKHLVNDMFRHHAKFAMRANAYEDSTAAVSDGDVFAGVQIVPLHGHTPGHSGYLVASKGEELLIWGDLVHQPALQFARPDVAVAWDVDPGAAVATRIAAFEAIADHGWHVTGAHLREPTLGTLRRGTHGSFSYAAT